MVELYDYQKQCLEQMRNYYQNKQKGLITIPTGGGKTIIFSHFARDFNKTIVLSHRDELVNQAIDKANLFFNFMETGIIKKDSWDIDSRFISASVQTLHRQKRSTRFSALINSNIDLLICDEAHHFPTSSYQEVYHHLKKANPELKLLGVTATPFRLDKVNLKDHFNSMIYQIDIKELIRLGYLVPVKGKICKLPIDLDELAIYHDDFTEQSISMAYDSAEINNMIVGKWLELARDKKTIFFTSSISHSKNLVAMFKQHNINACHIDGNTSDKKRKAIIEGFRKGDIKIISNMNILTEGFDDPSVECIALCRPTKSLALYVQIVGRGLRRSPLTGKKNCLVLDFTGTSQKHKIANLAALFGISAPKKELDEFQIGSEKDRFSGERKINLLIGQQNEDFEIEDSDVCQYITMYNNYKILGCGFNNTKTFLPKACELL